MKLAKLLPVMAIVLFSYSCSTDSVEEDKIEAVKASLYIPPTKTNEIEIMELINEYRINQGLTPLAPMEVIKAEAFSHTDYMIENSEVSHANFYQRRTNLVNNAGAKSVGENIAYAYSSPESVVNAWINSDGHRAILEGDFTNFDISAEKDADGRWYYTNIFINK